MRQPDLLPASAARRGARLSVPAGEPEETSCGRCATPLPHRPAPRCGHCGHWLGPPLAIELLTASVIALLLARFGGQPAVAAFGYLAIVGVALSQVDSAVQRLPDRLTLPAYPALILLLAVAAAITGDWSGFGRALLGGLATAAGYLALGVLSRGQVGGGDIKLAGLIGLVLGWLGWHTLIAGAFADSPGGTGQRRAPDHQADHPALANQLRSLPARRCAAGDRRQQRRSALGPSCTRYLLRRSVRRRSA